MLKTETEISVSLDIDWAPDEVIDYSLSLLDTYGVTSTLFMTHLTEAGKGRHEIAIHPNFTSLELEQHIEERMRDYPGSEGVRSHSFFFTERLRPIYRDYGFLYQSNVMMYMQDNIKPYYMAPGMVEVPLYWMDNFYIEMEAGAADFTLPSEYLESPGLKLFNFHPVHVFLNTCSLQDYEQAKKYYHQADELVKYRNTARKGVGDMFVELLKYIADKKMATRSISGIARQYKEESK